MQNGKQLGLVTMPACTAVSVAGFPQLYFYMVAQRRKVLRSGRSGSMGKLKPQ